MGKNNRKWTRWGSGNGTDGGWTWGNGNGGSWGGSSDGSWGGSNEGSAAGAEDAAAAPSQGKNWKCDACGLTTNCPWWWKCGRESCQAPWKPRDTSGTEAAATAATSAELTTTREKLATLTTILDPNDPALVTWADKVHALEQAQKTGVTTAERLRRLLLAQKQLESKQTAALAAMDKAKSELSKATTLLQSRMEECDSTVAEIAANALEIAEVTRSAAPQVAAPVNSDGTQLSMVQNLRAQIDVLTPDDLAEAGLDLASMGGFLGVFSKIQALLDRAAERSANVITITPPAAAPPAPAPIESTGGQPDPVRTVLPADGFSEEEEDKDELTDKGAAKRELVKAEKLLETVRVAEAGGSSG